MSWQARVANPAENAELWLTVCGRSLREAEANAVAAANLHFRADPNQLQVVSVHQLPNRRDSRS